MFHLEQTDLPKCNEKAIGMGSVEIFHNSPPQTEIINIAQQTFYEVDTCSVPAGCK